MSALLVGYARVSTQDQDLTAQRDALVALGVSIAHIETLCRGRTDHVRGENAEDVQRVREQTLSGWRQPRWCTRYEPGP